MLQKLTNELKLHDVGEIIDGRDASTHWTFVTNNDVNDRRNFTYKRIDYILASSLQGVEDAYIDSTYLVNPLGVAPELYDSFSDHVPISIRLNLFTLAGALRPDTTRFPTMTKTKYPEEGVLRQHPKVISQFGNFTRHLDEGSKLLMQNPGLFSEIATKEELDTYTTKLQDILGNSLPHPFQRTFRPGTIKIPRSKEMSKVRARIAHLKAVRRAVSALHKYSTATNQGANTCATFKIVTAARLTIRNGRYVETIRAPSFAHRRFDIDEEEVVEWMKEVETKRKALWHEYREREKEFRDTRSKEFIERYQKEAAKYSHELRVMCYPKNHSESAMAVIVNGGELVVDRDGIKNAYKESWAELAKGSHQDNSSSGDNPKLEDFVRDVPEYALLKHEVGTRSSQVYATVGEEEMADVIRLTPKRAGNPLDNVEVATLKLIFELADVPEVPKGTDLDPAMYKLCQENCAQLKTLILGLTNAIITTGIFPKAFLNGVIVPLFKKGDNRDLNNYRGITLLPILYKLVTKIINNRMMKVISNSNGMSDIQAAGRPNFSCLTQVNVLQNVIKHAHRHNKPLYILSTDVRKAFDTVNFDAFLNSLSYIGFDEKVRNMIHNLQTGFNCTVRSPVGYTDFFPVEQGCKQGCALSPLRFNIVYDIFLKFIEHNNMGYKWEVKHAKIPEGMRRQGDDGHVLNIPGCAFADDNLIMSDDPIEFKKMIGLFSLFLKAVGLNLGPSKCHYTTFIPNGETPPEISVPDHMGNACAIPHRPNTIPFEYLGYLMVVGDISIGAAAIWKHHNMKLVRKFTKAIERMELSSFRQTEVVRIVNADIHSILGYFFAGNWMAMKTAGKKKEEGDASCNTVNGLSQAVWELVSKKLKCMLCTPRGAVFNKSSGRGFGVDNVVTTYYTAKIDNLLHAVHSPSK